MKCPDCVKEGLKSNVYPGHSYTTAMFCRPYYDEDGKLHVHDMNTTTTSYYCSNNHTWSKSHQGSCWCGWGVTK